VSFPVTDKYFLRFRHSDVGLTPVFTMFKRTDTLANVTPPTITEVANGTYYFSFTFNTATDPGYVFEVDGGASIPTEEVRYIADTISPKDYFMDEPVSQVKDDVWNDEVDRAGGTKGQLVENIGTPLHGSIAGDVENARSTLATDVSNAVTTLGGDITSARDALRGTDATQSLTALDTKLDAMDVEIAAIQLRTDNLPANTSTSLDDVKALVARALGMLHENGVLDRCQYHPTTNNLLSARLRIYDTAAGASAAKAAGDGVDYLTGMIGQYSIVAEYSGDNMTNYLVVREFPADGPS
jgi:hypothetical protein